MTLADYRRRRDLTQQELANKLGVDVQTVSNWERAVYDPGPWHVFRMSRIFKVPLRRLKTHLTRRAA